MYRHLSYLAHFCPSQKWEMSWTRFFIRKLVLGNLSVVAEDVLIQRNVKLILELFTVHNVKTMIKQGIKPFALSGIKEMFKIQYIKDTIVFERSLHRFCMPSRYTSIKAPKFSFKITLAFSILLYLLCLWLTCPNFDFFSERTDVNLISNACGGLPYRPNIT